MLNFFKQSLNEVRHTRRSRGASWILWTLCLYLYSTSLFHISISYLYTYIYLSIPIVSPLYLFAFSQEPSGHDGSLCAVQSVDPILFTRVAGHYCTNTRVYVYEYFLRDMDEAWTQGVDSTLR